jgi:hypothetical protein
MISQKLASLEARIVKLEQSGNKQASQTRNAGWTPGSGAMPTAKDLFKSIGLYLDKRHNISWELKHDKSQGNSGNGMIEIKFGEDYSVGDPGYTASAIYDFRVRTDLMSGETQLIFNITPTKEFRGFASSKTFVLDFYQGQPQREWDMQIIQITEWLQKFHDNLESNY